MKGVRVNIEVSRLQGGLAGHKPYARVEVEIDEIDTAAETTTKAIIDRACGNAVALAESLGIQNVRPRVVESGERASA